MADCNTFVIAYAKPWPLLLHVLQPYKYLQAAEATRV